MHRPSENMHLYEVLDTGMASVHLAHLLM